MPQPTHPLAGRRILVVEDEYLIAIEVKRWLMTAGAEIVGPVPSVKQALDLLADHDLDAAVLDVNLGDGARVYPVADELSAIGVPYLFATGDVKVADASGYQHQPRLEKPFSAAELVRALVELSTKP